MSTHGTIVPTVSGRRAASPRSVSVTAEVVSVAPKPLYSARPGKASASLAIVTSGIAAPPKCPMRQQERSRRGRSGCNRQRLYIAGTITAALTRRASIRANVSAALNWRCSTRAPPTCSATTTTASNPEMCEPGMVSNSRSSAV